jgi:isocitrate dehydrogenase
MSQKTPITAAHGDGIEEVGAQLQIETIEIGGKVYLRGNTAGVDPSVWESVRRTKLFYKAPITTPRGRGFKSLNVTARKRLGLYANIRPCVAYAPSVDTKHPGMDVHRKVTAAGYDIVKTETLRTFDGQQGFTLAQGQ